MAIGWLALLKAVPWADVAKKAPEVAESARKLWNTIAKKSPKPDLKFRAEHTVFTSNDQEIDWLKERLAATEAAYSDLQGQMLSSAELIKALAEQNTHLISRVELNRKHIIKLTILTIIIGLIAVYCFTLTFTI